MRHAHEPGDGQHLRGHARRPRADPGPRDHRTGFGQDGPYAGRAGYDFIIQGMGGAMSLTGEPDGAPQKSGIAYADLFTGLYASVAILAALRERDRTGRGAHVDMALLDTQVGVLANQALNWMVSGKVPHRMGNGHANLVPYQASTPPTAR
jgi:crotonobetainyl-CoA:carnitine CoA-transferase CaiB-like acyl-CoA transferase